MLFKRPPDEKGAAWPAILVGLFASFGGILYGYDTGTIAGIQTMPYWLDEFNHPSEGRISLIVSILSVGTFVGALAAGIIADITGRRWGIIISVMLPFNLGVALQTAATAQPLFIAGRFFAGLGVGLVSAQGVLSRRKQLRYPLLIAYSSHVPIRNSTQMDQRCSCGMLSAMHHNRPFLGRYCELGNPAPERQRYLPMHVRADE